MTCVWCVCATAYRVDIRVLPAVHDSRSSGLEAMAAIVGRVINDDGARRCNWWHDRMRVEEDTARHATSQDYVSTFLVSWPCTAIAPLLWWGVPTALEHACTLVSLPSNSSHYYLSCVTFVHSSCQFVCDRRSCCERSVWVRACVSLGTQRHWLLPSLSVMYKYRTLSSLSAQVTTARLLPFVFGIVKIYHFKFFKLQQKRMSWYMIS